MFSVIGSELDGIVLLDQIMSEVTLFICQINSEAGAAITASRALAARMNHILGIRIFTGIAPTGEFNVHFAIMLVTSFCIPGKQAEYHHRINDIDSSVCLEDITPVPERGIKDDFGAIPIAIALTDG